MTTENETRDPRPVEELIKLDSFEGMTDEEVQSVIDLKCTWAYNDGKRAASFSESNERNSAYTDALNELHESAKALKAAAQNANLNLQVISYE